MADGTDTDYDPLFTATGQKYGIDPLWLKAQAQYESGLDPAFKSTTSSASGLGAFTDATAKDYNVDRTDPASSIDGLGRYLRDNYVKAKGNPNVAISMYKTGPNAGTVDQKYVDGVTGVYQRLKKTSGAATPPKSQMADSQDLDPQDDFERTVLGQGTTAKAADLAPQDDFERAVLGQGTPPVKPQDALEQQLVAPTAVTPKQDKADSIKAQYNEALANARAAMKNTGESPTTGAVPAELGYAANLAHQIPGLTELGSGLAATAENLTTPAQIPATYNRLQQAQQAMRQASAEQNPEATAIGEVGAGLATAPLFPAIGGGATSSLGKIASGAATGGVYGTLYGLGQGDASQSTEDSAYTRLGNAAKAGPAGLLLGGAIPAAVETGRGAANVFSGANMSPEVAQLAKDADAKYGIKIPGGLLSDSPLVNRAYSGLNRLGLTGKNDNVANFTKAVSNTFGEDTPKLTRVAMSKAADNIGDMYDDVRAQTPQVKVTNDLLNRLGSAESMASQLLPDTDKRIKNQISSILDVAAKNNGTIPVATWQNLVGSKSALTALTKSGLDPAAGPAQEIKGALYDALGASAPPQAQAKFNQANQFYKNFKTVQQKGLDPTTGEFSPTALASNVTRTAKKYGSGGLNDLQELGDIGRQFQLTPSSGTAENLIMAKGLGGGLEAGLAFHDPILALKVATGALGTAAAGRAAGAALSSDWYRNQLIDSALKHQGPGAISNFFAGTNYAPAVAYGANKLLQGSSSLPSIGQ